MLTPDQCNEAAEMLDEAARTTVPIEPLTRLFDGLDVNDAYQIQMINIRRREGRGSRIKGYKVGLTARAMQLMLGVNEPDYGHLLSDMFFNDGDVVPMNRWCSPKIEVETDATGFIVPVFELIDSRIRDWKITLADTIADNASSAAVVIGNPARSPLGLDLRLMGAVLSKNGEIIETGANGAVLGNPAIAVAWLVNKLAELGETVVAGSVVIPGSCTRAIDVNVGDTVRAEFDGLGSVSVAFA
jgi:2-keto-4-pentenoate hydratase